MASDVCECISHGVCVIVDITLKCIVARVTVNILCTTAQFVISMILTTWQQQQIVWHYSIMLYSISSVACLNKKMPICSWIWTLNRDVLDIYTSYHCHRFLIPATWLPVYLGFNLMLMLSPCLVIFWFIVFPLQLWSCFASLYLKSCLNRDANEVNGTLQDLKHSKQWKVTVLHDSVDCG